MDGKVSEHPGVSKPTELSAGDFIRARFRCFKPHIYKPTGKGILLEPELRDKEAMNNIVGREPDMHHLVNGDMQLVLKLQVIVSAPFTIRALGKSYPS